MSRLLQADLRPFLTTNFAMQFENFASMLDLVVDEVRTGGNLPSAEASKEASEHSESEENDAEQHLEGSEHVCGREAAEDTLRTIGIDLVSSPQTCYA